MATMFRVQDVGSRISDVGLGVKGFQLELRFRVWGLRAQLAEVALHNLHVSHCKKPW